MSTVTVSTYMTVDGYEVSKYEHVNLPDGLEVRKIFDSSYDESIVEIK